MRGKDGALRERILRLIEDGGMVELKKLSV